jgi:hypothetical protein
MTDPVSRLLVTDGAAPGGSPVFDVFSSVCLNRLHGISEGNDALQRTEHDHAHGDRAAGESYCIAHHLFTDDGEVDPRCSWWRVRCLRLVFRSTPQLVTIAVLAATAAAARTAPALVASLAVVVVLAGLVAVEHMRNIDERSADGSRTSE